MNKNDYRLRAYQTQANDDLTNKSGDDKYAQKLDAATSAIKRGGLLKIPREDGAAGQPFFAQEKAAQGDSVYRRVAKFLLLIGSDQAAEVFKHLPQSDVEKIIPELTTIRSVGEDEAAAIFEEFC